MQQTDKYWTLLNRILLAIIALFALVGLLMAFVPKVRQKNEYQRTRNELQRHIDATVAREKRLQQKQQRFLSDSEFVERIAHEVGYAHPNEIIYRFPEEENTNGPTR